jgi:hypothetical protein
MQEHVQLVLGGAAQQLCIIRLILLSSNIVVWPLGLLLVGIATASEQACPCVCEQTPPPQKKGGTVDAMCTLVYDNYVSLVIFCEPHHLLDNTMSS